MLTSSLTTLLKKQYPDWSTQNLVDIINEVHRICVNSVPVNQMRLYEASGTNSTGDISLVTTSGTYEYEIDTTNGFSSNVWRVTEVYSDDRSELEDVICYDATKNVSAKIVFKENPGGGTFYLRCYKKATEISSASIQLQIPEDLVLFEFAEGVRAYVELTTNGNSERWMVWKSRMLPKIFDKLNSGARGNPYNVEYKGY